MRLMVAKGTDERVLALHTEVTTLATLKLAGRVTSRHQMSSFAAWSDGDGVSLGKGWLHGLVDALGSHEQAVDRTEVQHVDVAHTFLGIEVCESNVLTSW